MKKLYLSSISFLCLILILGCNVNLKNLHNHKYVSFSINSRGCEVIALNTGKTGLAKILYCGTDIIPSGGDSIEFTYTVRGRKLVLHYTHTPHELRNLKSTSNTLVLYNEKGRVTNTWVTLVVDKPMSFLSPPTGEIMLADSLLHKHMTVSIGMGYENCTFLIKPGLSEIHFYNSDGLYRQSSSLRRNFTIYEDKLLEDNDPKLEYIKENCECERKDNSIIKKCPK